MARILANDTVKISEASRVLYNALIALDDVHARVDEVADVYPENFVANHKDEFDNGITTLKGIVAKMIGDSATSHLFDNLDDLKEITLNEI